MSGFAQSDRELIFKDYQVELVRREEERIAAERLAKREAEKKAREDFRKMLQDRLESGALSLGTRWHDIRDEILALDIAQEVEKQR